MIFQQTEANWLVVAPGKDSKDKSTVAMVENINKHSDIRESSNTGGSIIQEEISSRNSTSMAFG